MSAKIFFRTFVALIAIVAIANVLNINGWLARYSVPAGAYLTLLPFPFNLESEFSDGSFQGLEIRATVDESFSRIKQFGDCRAVLAKELVELGHISIADLQDGEFVMRCSAAGVAWNQIIVIRSRTIVQVRVAGGLWM